MYCGLMKSDDFEIWLGLCMDVTLRSLRKASSVEAGIGLRTHILVVSVRASYLGSTLVIVINWLSSSMSAAGALTMVIIQLDVRQYRIRHRSRTLLPACAAEAQVELKTGSLSAMHCRPTIWPCGHMQGK